MRKTFLAGLLLSLFSVSAQPLVSPSSNTNALHPTQDYLSQAITFEVDQVLDEGILAYANLVAQGDKVTVLSSGKGLAILEMGEEGYQLVQQILFSDLGYPENTHVNQLMVAASDKWLMLVVNDTVVSMPLDTNYQVDVTQLSSIPSQYGTMYLAGELAVLDLGSAIETYGIAATTGKLTKLNEFAKTDPVSNLAVSNGLLLLGYSSWANTEDNLVIYRFDDNSWQRVASHKMAPDQWGNHYVDHLTISPSGRSIIYGGNNTSYIFQFDPTSAQLTEITQGFNLFDFHTNDIRSLTDNSVLLRAYDSLRLINPQNGQVIASADLSNFQSSNFLRHLHAQPSAITLLSNTGLIQLDATSLTQKGALKPGEQDIVLNFGMSPKLYKLNEHSFLQHDEHTLRLFKVNELGLPEQIQSSSMLELLVHNNFYFNFEMRALGEGLFVFLSGSQYTLVRQDPQTALLQNVSHGILTGRDGNPLYYTNNAIAVLDGHLVMGSGDTLNLYSLTPSNQLQFVDAVVNGASGITGIAQVDMLLQMGNNLYTVDNQQQKISHFALNDNRLQQKRVYSGLSFPGFTNHYQRNDLITLLSNQYLQVLKVAANGDLTFLGNQFLMTDNQQWLPIGERFVAVRNWDGFHILEQDDTSGAWANSLQLSNEQLWQDHQFNQSSLVSLAGSLGIYGPNAQRLLKFKHNSAPFVPDSTKLSLALNQGQRFELALPTVIRDEEDAELTFTLEQGAAAFSINTNNQLVFTGQSSQSGRVAVVAADPAELSSGIVFTYQLNLAPTLTGTLPAFSVEEGTPLQIELAQYFTDPEGKAVQFALATGQAGLTLSSTGLLTGRLNSAGTATVNFNVSDAAGAISAQSLQINVTAKPKESSGGSVSGWLLSLLMVTALVRVSRRR